MEPLINQPQTSRGKKTLNNIVNAAIEAFYEKGYHNTSISDITRLAGVASGTFYIYFDGKYSLYKYLLLQCSHVIRRHLSQSIKNCTTRREAERAGLKSWLEFVLENQYLYGIIWESMYIDRQLFDDYYINFCKGYMKGLSDARLDGELADIDLEVLAYTLMGASNFIGLNWGLFNKDTSQEEVDRVVDEFMKILDNGIFNSAITSEKKETPQKNERKRPFHLPLDLAD